MSSDTGKRIGMAVAILGLMAGAARPANAGALFWNFSYDFAMTSGPDTTAAGTLTTTDVSNGDGSYTIIAITGTRTFQGNIDAILGLTAPGGYGGNDNELFPTSPFLSVNGVTFTISSATDGNSGDQVNVYFDAQRGYTEFDEGTGNGGDLNISNTPEPATSVFAGTGGLLIAVGYALRRKANRAA
jgi:hypothetical protein